MEEIWRDIYFYNKPTEEWIDYRGIYQVSNLGRIKSLDRYVRGFNHGKEHTKLIKGIVIKCRPNRYGYYLAHLSKNGGHRDYSLHRLVYFSFNPSDDTSLQVNHINEKIDDNRLINLNLMTASENSRWGSRPQRISAKLSGVSKGPMPEWHKKRIAEGLSKSEKMKAARKIVGLKNSKIISCFTKEGVFVRTYVSSAEAGREIGINSGSINQCCNNKRPSAGEFKWKKGDYSPS